MINNDISTIKNSEQYPLSEKILDLRYSYGLTLDEMNQILGMTDSEYAQLEFCNTSIPVSRYEEVINTIQDYIDNHLTEQNNIANDEIDMNFVINNESFTNNVQYNFTLKGKNNINIDKLLGGKECLSLAV
ncbi:hypothetical protein [Aerococcus urinae]|uniref:Uncharacterized protein n=1 Tax=Aerococcus urinae TaxID=1376 RepID=A0A0X8FEQ8_9LACT|nr:hypothetical protein [Aerococcus urinae]AMB95986.1 hypothetical protein AWM73_05445 [Aerococcus urinae]MCY3033069.1 hypothetical protein [Aerococcus urinae]MCY3038213.1 hypothetical protein [Aerococcus urinae]MCY3045115.1 hypothetical protein [Aerococcus urinae]MCY3046620.1 hypothetical protein [Aerococcus urinae]